MSRAVTADHVLFGECIAEFRPPRERESRRPNPSTTSYLLPSFELSDEWRLPHCVIHPSSVVRLPGPYSAFLCRVDNPAWVDGHHPQLYGLALAAVIAFVTGRPCKSTRDGYYSRDVLQPDQLLEISLSHPILVTGPGAMFTELSELRRSTLATATASLMDALYSAPYEKYVSLMQAIRLVHLSLLNKRDDFGLAYFLLVSAIESVAQIAVERSEVRRTHPSEQRWAMEARDSPIVKEVLSEYRRIRGEQHYAKERYVEFIRRFAPPAVWEEVVPHPYADISERIEEIQPGHDTAYLTSKAWHEFYPEDLSPEVADQILAESYAHRSGFTHRGQQPPHEKPTGYNRFFQEVHSFEADQYMIHLLPNYELLLGIAQRSISTWAGTE